jgi:hypothetical protein
MTSKKKETGKSKKSGKKLTPAAKKAPKVGERSRRLRIGVLIAEDHSVVREGLALITRKQT